MRFPAPLVEGRLLLRHKRFLAEVRLEDGRWVTAHCPNPGSMRGCMGEGARVLVSRQDSPGRRLGWTWELVRVGRSWVGIHTGRANAVVGEALREGRVPELAGYSRVRGEVPYGAEGSRADFLMEGRRLPRAWVEVKNVTLAEGRRALFPDSVTERGTRHLRELARRVRAGERGVLVFLVARGDCREVAPADAIDPLYGRTLREAAAAGVEVLAWRARVSPRGIRLARPLPVRL